MICPTRRATPLLRNPIVLFVGAILLCAGAPGWAQAGTAYPLLAAGNTSYATSLEGAAAAVPKPSGNSLHAELTYFHYDYNESVPPPAKSQEIGWIPGIVLGADFRDPKEAMRGNLLLEIAAGETDYRGSLQDYQGNYVGPYLGRTSNRFVTAEGAVGLRVTSSDSPIDIAPYLGLGLRLWHRGLQGPYGYNEDYGWFYLPLGIKAEAKIASGLTVGLDASVRPKVLGWISVSGLGGGNLFGVLGNKMGYRVETPITLRVGKGTSIELKSWYDYSAIGRGDIKDGMGDVVAYEPDSETSAYGGNLALLFSF